MQDIIRKIVAVIPISNERIKSIYNSEARTHAYEDSTLYFVECKSQLIVNIDYNLTDKIVTIIFMSFTNMDILITLPGDGLTMKGPL
jgi:hypothetical protein